MEAGMGALRYFGLDIYCELKLYKYNNSIHVAL
jgi:hypothetical protein